MLKNKKYKLVAVAIILTSLITGSYFFSQSYSLEPTTLNNSQEYSSHYDLGQISMKEGLKQLTYTFKNDTDGPLQLKKLYTSCMCTKAKIIINGEESAFAGMQGHQGGLMPIDLKMELNPGQKAELLVEFDPNAHGPEGTGPMTRSVIIETNNTNQPQKQFTFAGVVVK